MYGENTNTMATPLYRVLPYPVIYGYICGLKMGYKKYMYVASYMYIFYNNYDSAGMFMCILICMYF